MRSKKADDYWRKISEDSAPLRLNRVDFDNLAGVGKGTFSFSSTINVVCGKNGLGKSTLLKSIYLTLSGNPHDLYPETVSRLDGSEFNVKLMDEGKSLEVGYPNTGAPTSVIYLDPSELCQVSLESLRREKNLDEIMEQHEFFKVDESSLTEIRRILGRSYKEIEVMEIDDLGSYKVTPFFRVTLNQNTYDSREMALGEFSVLFLWWLLWKRIETPHIVLIEEPENFLTPQAQRYLTDYLALVALKSKLWILLSTHSEHVIENVGVPSTSVVVENEIDGSVIVKNPRHKLEVLEHLGLDPKKRGLILVEDLAGKIVFEQACIYFGSFLLNDYEVIKSDGSGAMRSVLQNFPHDSKCIECVGVFDGDERGKVDTSQIKNSHFLPGDRAPEAEFRDLIREAPGACASALRVSEARLIEKLSLVTGQDHHDWLDNLGRSLGADCNSMVRDLSQVWIETKRDDFYALISELDPTVKQERLTPEIVEEHPSRIVGYIDALNFDRGFGFVTSDEGERYFLHFSNVNHLKRDLLAVSKRVSFIAEKTDKPLDSVGSIEFE
ncbi:AAA family ATPase [Marinobacter confluentis]|uniref:ATP-binding protein n=1 Tax=Marinobacter confluentis TaxID=1697557 RepID=A0A4Z1C7R1_9GAMM|nr:AAA family ATPase [Marinobacter confluentis]TGN41660.1 hypothetical protein E5Q11_03785 [Marinobacter confluentis]